MNKRIQHGTLAAAAAFAFMLAGGNALANDDPKAERADDANSQQPVGDTWITTKVKSSLLADEDVAGLQIDVDTVNGVVTLTGDVASQAQLEEARRIASEIEGVTDVDITGLNVDSMDGMDGDE
jgi:hyperosmotically inducible protein